MSKYAQSLAARIGVAILAAVAPMAAQEPASPRSATLVGQVIDGKTGHPLGDVGVQLVGLDRGVQTGIDGRFRFANVPAGPVTIHVRRLGYQPKTITGLLLEAGKTAEQPVALDRSVVTLSAVVASAEKERGSVDAALDEQRNATGIVSSISSEQIGRSPDANAAQAVQRVSGVTVQDGKYVFVRGLGERYTTTALNGARVPSPEPERKVVPLDLFPSGLIQSVTTSKTFTPDVPGDFSGAHVDIRTREFPSEQQLTYSASLGIADRTVGRRLAYAPGVGGEMFALANGGRALPAPARAAGDFSSVTRPQANQIINSFRDVWSANMREARPNASARFSVGGNEALFGRRVGYLVSGTYSYSQDSRENATRAVVGPSGTEKDRFTGIHSGESVLWGGLLNTSALLGRHSRLTLNGMYNRSADNDARVDRGFVEEFGLPMERELLSYVERAVWSAQLTGEHQAGRQALDWALGGSGVARNEPDRSELGYVLETGPGGVERKLWDFSGQGAVRTFSELDDKAIEGRANYKLELGTGHAYLKLGGLARGATRESDVRAFAIGALSMEDSVRALPPEVLFGGRFTAPDSSVLLLRPLSQGGSYSADDALFAGFAMLEAPITGALSLIGGARVEHAEMTVRSMSSIGTPSLAKPSFTDVLPSLALTYRAADAHTLRLSVSRTLARPEYREISGVATVDPVKDVILQGNPQLVRTLIDNVDVRYEFYPRRGEVLSAALFAKRFQNPIERVYSATSGKPVITWVNAESADNYGVELEARKQLDVIAEWLAPMTAFTSATLMQSRIELGSTASTNPNRAMVGQAPYVINAGLTWTASAGRTSATLLYNRVGPRVYEAGITPFPDAEELARDALDLSVRWPMRGGLSGRFDAKNLLNAPYEIRQGAVTRELYNVGRTFQLGLTVQR